jgi:hypothetical protein
MQNLTVFLFVYLLSFLGIRQSTEPITICETDEHVSFSKSPISFKTNTVPGLDIDPGKAYAAPTVQLTPKGEVMLIWTEKDVNEENELAFAISKDQGLTFEPKKTVAKNTVLSNGRMSKAKILFKKDGTMVAVYSQRFENPPLGKPAGRGPGGIVYSESKDGGSTWANPVFVDTDPSKKLLRGFFDAVIMPNDELAVVYLKDVAGSTKHEERNLRMARTVKGKLLDEKIIDPVACDCCPVNINVNAKGEVQVIYRDNNDDFRDMAVLTSSDFGNTFSASKILSPDDWKIAGCPHSGATSLYNKSTSLITWFSGSDKEPGLRLADQTGKKLYINPAASAKYATLAGDDKLQIIAWEENPNEENVSKLAYKTVKARKLSETTWVPGTENATGASALLIGQNLIMTYEIKSNNKRNQLGLKVVKI